MLLENLKNAYMYLVKRKIKYISDRTYRYNEIKILFLACTCYVLSLFKYYKILLNNVVNFSKNVFIFLTKFARISDVNVLYRARGRHFVGEGIDDRMIILAHLI
jgi:hypothetical protein